MEEWKRKSSESSILPFTTDANLPAGFKTLRGKFDLKEVVFRVKIYNNKIESLY